MEGNPARFEAIGSRLGFQVASETPESMHLVWRGAHFPAFLCLGIATALLFISAPIVEAIRLRGFEGPAGSLWYFPIMNLALLVVSLFLFSLKRAILLNNESQRLVLKKRSLFGRLHLRLNYSEVKELRLAVDEIYSGFALAGSSAGERHPVPSLRLILVSGDTVLLDRGGLRRLKHLGELLSRHLQKPFKEALNDK